MPRPANKSELLEQGMLKYEALMDCIDALSEEEQNREFPPGTLNRNIRDVLMHLHHWHLLFLDWYAKGMKGEKPEMPAKGYSWKTTPELNQWIREQYLDVSLKAARKKLDESFGSIRELIKHHTNEELFEKKKYPWTGSTSLGAYLISASTSHYDWALKLIKRATLHSK
jgi:hypothetical protein